MQHAGGAGLDRVGKPGRFQARAQDQRRHPAPGRGQLLDQPGPIPVRQPEVYYRDVRPVGLLADELVSLGQGPGLAGHDKLFLPLEHKGERLTKGDVILHEQDPGRILMRVVPYDSRLLP